MFIHGIWSRSHQGFREDLGFQQADWCGLSRRKTVEEHTLTQRTNTPATLLTHRGKDFGFWCQEDGCEVVASELSPGVRTTHAQPTVGGRS